MSNLFSRLEDLSNRLNASSDDVNETIRRVEAKLATLRLGVEAWLPEPPLKTDVQFFDEPAVADVLKPGMYVVKARLGYAKVRNASTPSGSWCLAISRHIGDLPHNVGIHSNTVLLDTTPLLQASRGMRILALHKIPALLVELERCAKVSLDSVEDAKKAAQTIL